MTGEDDVERSQAALVSCVIVCWRKPEPLRLLLKQLRDDRLEIIVVNPEIDPEVAAVAADCIHVPLEGDPGFAAAVNVGVPYASSDFIAFMNDDIEVSVDVILALREAVISGQADVAVPAVVDGTGQPEGIIKALPTPRALLREWCLLPDRPIPWLEGRLRVEKWRRPQRPEAIDACGTPLWVLRTALMRAMPQPEEYFLYWDDLDWCWQLREQGKVLVYFPDRVVAHSGGRREVSRLKSRLVTQNAVKCVRKTQGRAAARRAFAIMLAYNLRLLVIASLRVATRRRDARAELRARIAGLRATRASWYEVTGIGAIPAAP